MNSKKFSKKMKFSAIFMVFVLLSVWGISIINAPIAKAVDVVAAQTAELANTSTFSATSIVKGGYIKITGSATGGTSPYQYAVAARHSTSSKWTVLKNYSTSNTYTWTPAQTGTYYVSIKVKDNNGTVVSKTQAVKVAETQLVNNSTVSAASVVKGNSVKLTGAASGGIGSYQYAMVAKHSTSSKWTVLRNYSTSNSYTWTPAQTGTYYVSIKVKDSSGTVVSKTHTIKVTEKQLVNNSTISATTIVKGNSVKFTCAASGGISPYKYLITAKLTTSNTWVLLRDYNTSTTYTWTPTQTGTYDVSIKVKDSNGTVVSKTLKINVVEKQLVNNSTASATTIVKGNSVKLTCAASGGRSPYQYSISARPTTSNTWTLLRDYNTATTYTWTPNQTGSYYVRIIVKDSTGTTAVKTIGITVNASDKMNEYINEVIRLVNVERQKRGLSTLTKRDDVCEIAAIRAKEIVISFSHTRPNGSSCFSLFDEYNISYWSAGENIAYGYRTPAEVMEGWMNSEGHRANILNGNFDGIGVGCYEENGVLYWTQFFIG
ncbi:MAG: CAP domain-containing protein [Acutalibacteraceae bacterium]